MNEWTNFIFILVFKCTKLNLNTDDLISNCQKAILVCSQNTEKLLSFVIVSATQDLITIYSSNLFIFYLMSTLNLEQNLERLGEVSKLFSIVIIAIQMKQYHKDINFFLIKSPGIGRESRSVVRFTKRVSSKASFWS